MASPIWKMGKKNGAISVEQWNGDPPVEDEGREKEDPKAPLG